MAKSKERKWKVPPWSDEEYAIFMVQWHMSLHEYLSLTHRQRQAIINEGNFENTP